MIFGMLGGMIPGFNDLFGMFATAEVLKGQTNKSTVILRIKGQASLQQTIEGALGNMYQLIKALPKNQQLSFSLKSQYSFDDLIKNNSTLLQALKGYAVELRLHLIRDYLKNIVALTGDFGFGVIVGIITAPSDLDLHLKLHVDNLLPNEIKQKIDIPVSMGKEIVGQMVGSMLGGTLVNKVSGIHLTINAVDIYAQLKVDVPGLLK